MCTSFAELGLNEQILAGVDALGFTTPTPVQAAAIPAVLAGRDVVASAQTGTGKTAAFALPVLQTILPASRAAREELVTRPDDASDATSDDKDNGPDVLAFAASDESLSVPANENAGAGDGAKKPRRRRRRHKKVPAASNASQETRKKRSVQDAADVADDRPKPEPRPKRRRRRRRKRTPNPAASDRRKNPDARPFGPFALVVTPTRELAQQIDRVVSVVCEYTGQRAVIVMGGTKFERQIRELEAGCDMLVATPGRLIDLMEHDHVDLSHVQVLVLDEADRMLDMGFWPSVRRIVAALPASRQNLLFSATIPPSIKSTVDAMLHDPVSVEIARVGETADTVEEHLCPVTQGQKVSLLQELIRTGGAEQDSAPERVLVFCRTKQRVDDVSRTLKGAGFLVDVMHSDRQQKARERALSKFREGKCQVLVATDVMSRGIDVSGIDAVVNFDVPLDPEDYVHRIGRTGRAGATGHAYTFVAPDEISPLREIEYFTGKLVSTWDLPGFSYDERRIVPGATRSTVKPKRTMFSGMKSRGRGMAGGRYGRHY
ncbi:MAG: DEAD/DEAH box helicase [Atopobiaceae bacterium]|nr:DEAD/DEAH box helicase [Atopobiaceae bacterium]